MHIMIQKLESAAICRSPVETTVQMCQEVSVDLSCQRESQPSHLDVTVRYGTVTPTPSTEHRALPSTP